MTHQPHSGYKAIQLGLKISQPRNLSSGLRFTVFPHVHSLSPQKPSLVYSMGRFRHSVLTIPMKKYLLRTSFCWITNMGDGCASVYLLQQLVIHKVLMLPHFCITHHRCLMILDHRRDLLMPLKPASLNYEGFPPMATSVLDVPKVAFSSLSC